MKKSKNSINSFNSYEADKKRNAMNLGTMVYNYMYSTENKVMKDIVLQVNIDEKSILRGICL